MSFNLFFHGHATFTLIVNDRRVVIDPFFAPNNPVATKTVDQIEADYILQTHGHGDHIADTVALAQRTGAKVIANFEICDWLNAQGVSNTHAQHIGGGFNHDFGYVKMTPALHGSGLPDGSYGGMPGGFLIDTGDNRIYFAGDTALFSDMALIGEGGLDLAVLPIGDNFTMGPADSILAIKYLKPKNVIPCHYNTWPVIEQDVSDWIDAVRDETDARPFAIRVEQGFIKK